MTTIAKLPTFESRVEQIAAAEQGEGWLVSCIEEGRYLAPTNELVDALSSRLWAIGEGPRVEVCGGRGELAEALADRGVEIVATDASPPAGCSVLRASAAEALQRYRPRVVLGCFVPVDAGVDEAVLACPSVRHYVVLGARVGGEFGSAWLWRAPGWTRRPLPDVSRWMLTRHDIWTGQAGRPIVQHGEAWWFRRLGGIGPEEDGR
jgi:hypothetical protein